MTKISNQYSLTNVLFADAVNGRVGIGTTSPSYILDAYSTGASSARINIGGTTNFVTSQYTNSSGTMYVGIDDSAGANFTGTAYGRFIYSSGAYPLIFNVNSLERMRVDSSGSVGINGAPNPDSGDTRIQINGGQYGTLNLRSTSVNASVRAHNPNGGLYVGTTSNHFAAIFTNDAERMRITSGGNVLIATTTSNGSTVQINGSAYANIFRINDTNGGYVTFTMSTADRWFINYLGRFAGYGSGTLTTDANGNITASSDSRLKNIIKPIKNVLENIKDFKPVYFKWNEKTDLDKDNTYMSTIAQSIQEHYPEAVGKMEDGTLTVQDRAVTSILVAAIQELSAQASEQQTQINELKALLNA